MRVLHLMKTGIGGTWALRQMARLVDLGAEVHVALPPGPRVAEYEDAGIRVNFADLDFSPLRPGKWPTLFGKARELVTKVSPDLIHSHFVSTTLTMRLALGRKSRTPRVFQVPGPLHLEHAFFRGAEISLAGKPDHWIASCEWTRDRYLQSGVARDRVFLSYYGYDLGEFYPRAPGKLRSELGLPDTSRLVGMVAFMYPPKPYLGQARGLKGHEDLVDALCRVKEEFPETVGVFVGGAWNGAVEYESRVIAYAQARLGDGAIFLGTRDDVADLYADFDVAVHPSHSENLGGAAESLLLSVPTVATKVGGFPDLVRDGETGWLVPPRRPRELAKAIAGALRDTSVARFRAQTGRERARKMLDVQETASEVLTIYERILSGQGSSARLP